MKKQFSLLLLLSFLTLQSFKHIPTTAFSVFETNHALYLSQKFKINSEAIGFAISGYEKLKQLGQLSNARYLTIANFSQPSNEERLYIIDMEQQDLVIQTLVAHGKNSGTLFAKKFSNKNESNQSSLGFYITGDIYRGKHGNSLQLIGIEPGINDKAKQRAIVLHGADYVSNNAIEQMGYLGRSQGCPAVPNSQVAEIIETIQGESCFFIYAPDKQYLSQSQLIHTR